MPPPERPIEDERLVYGVHPVLEALEADPPMVDLVFVGREPGARTGRLCRLARERGVPVSHVDRETLRRRAGAGAVHQGVAAVLAAAPYARVAEVLAAARAAQDRALLVAAEGVDDPRNLGAILRSAAPAGASGALLAVERQRSRSYLLREGPTSRIAKRAQQRPEARALGTELLLPLPHELGRLVDQGFVDLALNEGLRAARSSRIGSSR